MYFTHFLYFFTYPFRPVKGARELANLKFKEIIIIGSLFILFTSLLVQLIHFAPTVQFILGQWFDLHSIDLLHVLFTVGLEAVRLLITIVTAIFFALILKLFNPKQSIKNIAIITGIYSSVVILFSVIFLLFSFFTNDLLLILGNAHFGMLLAGLNLLVAAVLVIYLIILLNQFFNLSIGQSIWKGVLISIFCLTFSYIANSHLTAAIFKLTRL